jgi:hypothetical protein
VIERIALLAPQSALWKNLTPEQEVPMARRKQVAVEEVQTPTQEAVPQQAQAATAVLELPEAEPRRPLLADPFPFKTVKLGDAKVHFQHSRQAGEFQIRFGDGSRNDMPSDGVRAFIKSHIVQIETANGPAEASKFHWNENDRAWGMRIDHDDPETSRQIAKKVFDDVVALVAEERGAGRER